MSESVAAVIVTFNRKLLLVECLNALLSQTIAVDCIIVIDNNSADGTTEYLQEKGYFDNKTIDYVRLTENTGGAGGFHEGMKRAYDANYDWLWLMDDDGYPAPECLEKLMQSRQNLDIIGPAVVPSEDHNILTWKLRVLEPSGYFAPRQYIGTYEALLEQSNQGIYADQANFFNGVLINRRVIEKIGYVIKELFIWGDEAEYSMRCKKHQIRIGTQVNAMFFHPLKSVSVNEMKYYYLFRNTFYIYGKYSDIMYEPLVRLFYPFYIFIKYLRLTPSASPKYLFLLIKAVLFATQGKLIPYNF